MSSLNFKTDGIQIHKALLSLDSMESIKAEISLESKKLKESGVRNLEKKFQSIADLTQNKQLLSIAQNLLNNPVKLVRALFFDKTAEKNWFVGWHQDKTVTLNKRIELEGWGPWSLKDKVHHVQPPVSVLEKMVTFRLHIDSADEMNGCLKVIPGTHQHGILKQQEIVALVEGSSVVSCVVEAADVVIMRPHIVHSSSKAIKPGHRRVVHLEYSSYDLPDGVDWA